MAFDAETLRVGGRDKTEATGPQPPLSSERNPVAATSPTNELPHREGGAFRNEADFLKRFLTLLFVLSLGI